MNGEVTIHTELGDFEIKTGRGWMSRDTQVGVEDNSNVVVEIASPQAEYEELWKAKVAIDCSDLDPVDVEVALRVLAWSSNIAELINEANADAIAGLEQAKAEQEQHDAELEAARNALIEERTDQLMNELMGEIVRVRHDGYRTTAKATVESRGHDFDGNGDPTSWKPWLRWDSSNNANRRHGDVENWKRLDIKTDKGWRTVWDDGDSDIGGARTKQPECRPWTGGLC